MDSHQTKLLKRYNTESVKSHSTRYLITILLIQQFIGALCFPISKFGLAYIEPFTFAFYRFVISSVLLFILIKIKKFAIPIEKSDYWKIIGLGVLIIPFNQTFYLWGQSMTAAGHGALLFATVPIWVLVAAMIHLKERPHWRRIIGIIIAVVGVITIMTSGSIKLGSQYLWGDLIILFAVLCWVYYTVLGKPLVEKYGAIRITAYALISGSIMYLPFGFYHAARFNYSTVPFSAWWSVVYMAVGTSIVAYILWYWVLKYIEASRIAVFNNLQPIIASSVAYFWLNEPIGIYFIIGGIITLAGVIIAEL